MTLRARLLVGMALVAISLVGMAAALKVLTERHLVDQIDDRLEGFSVPVGDLLATSTSGEAATLESDSAFLGVILAEEPSVMPIIEVNGRDGALPAPELPPERLADGAPEAAREPFTVESADGSTRYRAVIAGGSEFAPLSEGLGEFDVVLAMPLNDVDATMSRLVRIELVGVAVVLTVLAIVTWWMLRLGLRPVRKMTEAATVIAGGDLSRRVPDARDGTEAAVLGSALNSMLSRIEAAFDEQARSEERLRQFVADASHELRTPITTIRGYAELYRRGALTDPEEHAEAHRRTEEEAARMGALIDDLLTLADADEGHPYRAEPVDLSAVAVDAAADARAVEPFRQIDADVLPGVVVLGDVDRLRQATGNLVRNALLHTPADARVTVRVGVEGDEPDAAVFEVADEGPGMDDETARRAFERFYRADAARTRLHGGAGLGLSIVKAVVDLHGGAVFLERPDGGGTVIGFRLPCST
jgi:two-component system OmpR family sensor kinase